MYATQLSISPTPVPAVRKRKSRQQIPEETPVILDHEEVHHHQACAVVEQLINMDRKRNATPRKSLGEGDNEKEKHIDSVDKEKAENNSGMSSLPTKKWKIGPKLTERDQLKVLQVLTDNNDRFAYVI